MCLWNKDAPGKYGKISKSYILIQPIPQGHVMSMQPLDELTVQVWLLYDHPNFISLCKWDSITDKQTDGQTDRQTNEYMIWFLDAPGGPFRPSA